MTTTRGTEPQLSTTKVGGGRSPWAVALAAVAVLSIVVYVGVTGPSRFAAPEPTEPPVVALSATQSPQPAALPRPSDTPPPPPSPAGPPAPTIDIQPLGTHRDGPAGSYGVVISIGDREPVVELLEPVDTGHVQAQFTYRMTGTVPATVQIVQFSGADESPAPVVVIDGWTIHLFLSADSPRTVFDRDIAGEPDRSGLPRLAQAGYHVVAQANPTEDAQVSVLDVDVYAHRADAFDQPEKYELLMTIDGEDALGQFYRLEAGHYQAALVLGRDIPPTFTFVIRAVFATDHPPADSRRWKVKPKNLEAVGGGSLQLLHKVVGPEAGSAFPDGYVVDVSETNESDQANVWFDIYVLPLSDGRS